MADEITRDRARVVVDTATMRAETVSKKLWFLDLKFEQFATPRLIGFVFLLWLILATIGFVAFVFYALLTLTVIPAVLAIVAQAILLLISAVLVRVLLEAFLVIFRIAEHLKHLKHLDVLIDRANS